MANKLLSIVIPAHNESRTLASVLDLLFDSLSLSLPPLGYKSEVIVVDDGSTDDTYAVAAAAAKRHPVKVIRLRPNRGKGAALRAGVGVTRGDAVAFYDAGGDYRPEYLAEFIRVMESRKIDGVIGNKYTPRLRSRYPWWRRRLGHAFNSLTRTLTRLPYTDTQAGIKLFRADRLRPAMQNMVTEKYLFDVELLQNLLGAGARIDSVPVTVQFNTQSGKKILPKIFDVLFDAWQLIRKSKKPSRIDTSAPLE